MNRFSIVVVNYNKSGYLERVATNIKNIAVGSELILSDDHSDDGSWEWAKASGLFDKIFRKENREEYCLCTVRNEGIRLATREFVVLLDADCYPCSEYFINLTKLINEVNHSRIVAVGLTDHYNKDGDKILLEDPRKVYLGGNLICDIGFRDAFGGNVCFPVSLWKQVGGFDEDFNGFWGYEDIEFAYRCQKAGAKLVSRHGVLVKHLQHPIRANIEQSQLYGRNRALMNSKHHELSS